MRVGDVGTRVRVFVDYQNVYHGARDAFGGRDSSGRVQEPPTFGHIRPARFGLLLKQLGDSVDPERTLESVRLFRGEPVAGKAHPKLQASFQRQVGIWRALEPAVITVTRPLRYSPSSWGPDGRPNAWDSGEEKGIDVLLALGMVLGAERDEYDVAVVASGDTDLIPAIDEVVRIGKRVENAVWKPAGGNAYSLKSTERSIWVHRMTAKHFEWVRDDTNYSVERSDPASL